ncbi:MAG: ester cyclase, partial [Anaerolineae bacterium]|nr:ester cyclase [Anaerolineae bacterium]
MCIGTRSSVRLSNMREEGEQARSLEESRDVVRREVEFWNGHDAEAAGEVYAANDVGHDPAGTHAGSFEQLKQSAAAVFTAFPDLSLTADDVIVEGDVAV